MICRCCLLLVSSALRLFTFIENTKKSNKLQEQEGFGWERFSVSSSLKGPISDIKIKRIRESVFQMYQPVWKKKLNALSFNGIRIKLQWYVFSFVFHSLIVFATIKLPVVYFVFIMWSFLSRKEYTIALEWQYFFIVDLCTQNLCGHYFDERIRVIAIWR